PYTYHWSTGQTTSTISSLGVGTYTVGVTDAHGCTATGSITFHLNNLSDSIAGTTPTCALTIVGSGTATVSASGGGTPYTYSWSPTGQTTATATGLTAGTYTVTVTDHYGCSVTATATVGTRTCIHAAVHKKGGDDS